VLKLIDATRHIAVQVQYTGEVSTG